MGKIQLTENLDLELAVGLTVPKILEEMDNQFPEKSPEKGETLGDLMFRGGQRDVVLWLQRRLEEEDLELT